MNPFDYNVYDNILNYICSAMVKDENSPAANIIRALNLNEDVVEAKRLIESGNRPTKEMTLDFTVLSTAYLMFIGMVWDNHPWDYKPKLRERNILLKKEIPKDIGTLRKGTTFWFTPIKNDKEYIYYYDIWGNIHYGYLGRSIGFTRRELLEGSSSHNDLSGITGSSASDDQLGVAIGADLYDLHGVASTASLHHLIYGNRNNYTENTVRVRPENLGIIVDN